MSDMPNNENIMHNVTVNFNYVEVRCVTCLALSADVT